MGLFLPFVQPGVAPTLASMSLKAGYSPINSVFLNNLDQRNTKLLADDLVVFNFQQALTLLSLLRVPRCARSPTEPPSGCLFPFKQAGCLTSCGTN